jgi:hypothetical protein
MFLHRPRKSWLCAANFPISLDKSPSGVSVIYFVFIHLPSSRNDFINGGQETDFHRSNSTVKHQALYIPQTVIFSRRAEPATQWFFSNSSGKIMKKNQVNVTVGNILKAFLPPTPPVKDTASQRAAAKRDEQNKRFPHVRAHPTTYSPICKIVAQFVYSCEYVIPGQQYVVYLTAEALVDFLHHTNSDLLNPRVYGILQKFVNPGGTGQNSMLRVVWSPVYSSLESRTNHVTLTDRKVPLPDRAVTFDGPGRLSAYAPVRSSQQQERLVSVCGRMVAHVDKVLPHLRIKYLEWFCRLDDEGRLWILWVRSCRYGLVASPFARSLCLQCHKHVDFNSDSWPTPVNHHHPLGKSPSLNSTITASASTSSLGSNRSLNEESSYEGENNLGSKEENPNPEQEGGNPPPTHAFQHSNPNFDDNHQNNSNYSLSRLVRGESGDLNVVDKDEDDDGKRAERSNSHIAPPTFTHLHT